MSNATMKHDFEEVVKPWSDCKKWTTYGEDVIGMRIVETDFKCPQPIVDAMIKRAHHGIYGYPNNSKSFATAIKNWQLTKFMLEKAKVAMNDGETFGAPGRGFMRINIGCRRAVLEEALKRIEKAVASLR